MIHCLPILSTFIYTCICKNSLCMVCRLHDLCILCGSCKLCRSLILHPIFYRFFLYSLKNQIHVIKFDIVSMQSKGEKITFKNCTKKSRLPEFNFRGIEHVTRFRYPLPSPPHYLSVSPGDHNPPLKVWHRYKCLSTRVHETQSLRPYVTSAAHLVAKSIEK